LATFRSYVNKHGDDESSDIVHRRGNLIGQVNNVLWLFDKLDCSNRLLKSYCFDFYSCESWNLANPTVQSLRIIT